MAPVLDQVAPTLEGKMAIGKIDCTVQKSLCKEFKVRGFPSLMYSVDGEVSEYSGGREDIDLITFANKMSGPAVHTVQNYEEAMAYAAKETAERVAFLGFDPQSSPSEMTGLHQIFNQVARKKQASAYFVWLATGEEERTYPFIHKIEPNLQPKSYSDHDTDITQITTESLVGWVQANNVPLVSELTGANFNRVGRNGRPLLVSIVDYSKADQKKAVKEHMLSYASRLSTKEADMYYFGIMDGHRWAKFLTQFNVDEEDNPQMLIMDVPSRKFYQNATYKNAVEFVKAVDAGEIKQLTASKPKKNGLIGQAESLFLDNFPYSLILLVVLVFGFAFLLVPSGDMGPPYDRETDVGEIIDDDAAADGAPESSEPKKEK
jgi:hypothetical protein